jgi:hypothetical protein
MNNQLLQALIKAHLKVWGSRTGARKLENLYDIRVYRYLYRPLAGDPTEKGGQVAEHLKREIATWNSEFRHGDLQPSVTQCKDAIEILFNLEGTTLKAEHRRREAILKLEWDNGVESWRSHNGGVTGPEVEFAKDFARHQLRLRHLI